MGSIDKRPGLKELFVSPATASLLNGGAEPKGTKEDEEGTNWWLFRGRLLGCQAARQEKASAGATHTAHPSARDTAIVYLQARLKGTCPAPAPLGKREEGRISATKRQILQAAGQKPSTPGERIFPNTLGRLLFRLFLTDN